MTTKTFFLASIIIASTLTSCEGQADKSKSQTSNNNQNPIDFATSDTTAQIMNENDFWKIINKSREVSNNNYQTQINSLKTILLTLDASEIEKFDNTLTALLAASYDWKPWGASYVINGGCSDDCFDYFRQYLIAHGKEKFYKTLKDPESCANWIKSEEEDNWEGLQNSVFHAYKEKTGKELPQTYSPKFELKGKQFDEEKLIKEYPKLAKKFMGNE